MMNDMRLRIAVGGGGFAGIGAAHLLQRCHEVSLFERDGNVYDIMPYKRISL